MLKRLAILHSRMSGYIAACQRALKEKHSVELLCWYWPVTTDAPFDDSILEHLDHGRPKEGQTGRKIARDVLHFEPQAVLMSGWADRDYMDAARQIRKRGIPVIAGSDAQWSGTFRQQLGRVFSRLYLHSSIDALWVPGERQRQFAARLGFSGERCWSGVYACDWKRFAAVFDPDTDTEPDPAFLFVGRYAPEKGLDILSKAYRLYRERAVRPWKLICAGTGRQSRYLRDIEGVEDRGFVQPEHLPALMRESSAFVLPSRREPWGVVAHEAATAGLPLVCSDACGAAVHLLQDGYNGYMFESGNADHLAACLEDTSSASEEELAEMSVRSHQLSKQFTPERWADTLVRGVRKLTSNESTT